MVGTSLYGARLRINPNGTVQLHLMRDGTALSGGTLPGITLAAGTRITVRVQAEGTNPTTLRARAWPTAGTEPTTWQFTTTDPTTALQQPGNLRLSTYLRSSATNGPITVTYDDLTATAIGAPPPPPPNAPPTAAFTWTAAGLTVNADSTSSSDSDGTIASRSWDFDGVSGGSGILASRTFPAAGTYPVSLTVTDDDGATATTTQSVTVSAPPPAGALAQDAFGRTVASGWGTADTGGPWTVNSTAKFSVASGTGRVAANAGSTLNATLGQVSSTAIDLTTALTIDKVPNQASTPRSPPGSSAPPSTAPACGSTPTDRCNSTSCATAPPCPAAPSPASPSPPAPRSGSASRSTAPTRPPSAPAPGPPARPSPPPGRSPPPTPPPRSRIPEPPTQHLPQLLGHQRPHHRHLRRPHRHAAAVSRVARSAPR